jgi:glycosyltransferase involved in cell wall biosynthesis
MNILHLNQAGSHVGGVEGYIAEVSTAMQAAGHASHLVYFEPDDAGTLLADTTYAFLPEWPQLPMQAQQVLDGVMARFRPDIAYIHAVYHPGVVEWIAQRLPTVAYVHGPYLVCPGSAQYLRRRAKVCPHTAGLVCLFNAQIEDCCWGRNPLRHAHLLRRVRAFASAYHHVKYIFMGSRFMSDLLQRGGIAPEKLALLSPVLNAEPLPPLSPATDSRTVLFAGRLTPEKGLAYLVQALSLVASDWQLMVAGDGPERQRCEMLAEQLGIAGRVSFIGWVSPAEMRANLQACACVAVPSLWPEPFGRLGPEAFLYSRPVVAFAVGGVLDWLEDGVTGYRVESGDVIGLARALERLLASPGLRRQMGLHARRKAVEDWSAQLHVEQLLAVFAQAQASL